MSLRVSICSNCVSSVEHTPNETCLLIPRFPSHAAVLLCIYSENNFFFFFQWLFPDCYYCFTCKVVTEFCACRIQIFGFVSVKAQLSLETASSLLWLLPVPPDFVPERYNNGEIKQRNSWMWVATSEVWQASSCAAPTISISCLFSLRRAYHSA